MTKKWQNNRPMKQSAKHERPKHLPITWNEEPVPPPPPQVPRTASFQIHNPNLQRHKTRYPVKPGMTLKWAKQPPNKAKCEARATKPETKIKTIKNLPMKQVRSTSVRNIYRYPKTNNRFKYHQLRSHNSSISDTASKPPKTQNQIPGLAGYD